MTARVVVISLSQRLPRRVESYVNALATAGVGVDLLVTETVSTAGNELDPRVRVHTVFDVEADRGIARAERGLVFTLPGRAFGKARSLTADKPALRLVDAALAVGRRGQSRLFRGFHDRLFWPAYRFARPMALTRTARGPAEALDLSAADRIVAGDPPAVPLAWRLARKYPDVRVTSALDTRPYLASK